MFSLEEHKTLPCAFVMFCFQTMQANAQAQRSLRLCVFLHQGHFNGEIRTVLLVLMLALVLLSLVY